MTKNVLGHQCLENEFIHTLGTLHIVVVVSYNIALLSYLMLLFS